MLNGTRKKKNLMEMNGIEWYNLSSGLKKPKILLVYWYIEKIFSFSILSVIK